MGRHSSLTALVAIAVAGCTGAIDPPAGGALGAGGAGPGSAVAGGGGPATGTTSAAPGGFVPAPSGLHRLRVSEYLSSLRDLLGKTLTLPTDVASDTSRGFSTLGAAIDAFAAADIERFESAAYAAADQIFGDPVRAKALVGCTPASPSDPCIEAFVRRFGRRAWRRPLTDAETQAYTKAAAAIGASLGSPWQGLRYVLAGLLQSPSFLYRVDLGEPDPAQPGRLRYSPYEMAARLSFRLLETTPGDALLDAAAAGGLLTADDVRSAATPMTRDARALPALLRFFDEHLKLEALTLDLSPKDRKLFPDVSDALYASMRKEVELEVGDLLARDQSIFDLLALPALQVDAQLAKFYGLPAATGSGFASRPVTATGARSGYLTSGAFLAPNAHVTVTSPTRRGLFVRQALLCQDLAPPNMAVAALPADAAGVPRTMRQKLETHRADPSCAGCHALMDPMGLAFEHFDALGAYRDSDHGLAIDTSGEIEGQRFAGPAELAQLLRRSPAAKDCLVTQAYRYLSGHVESDGEASALDQVRARFATGGERFAALVLDLVSSDAFRFATRPE